MRQVPSDPKIYHIVHVDRLSSIVSEGCLWSDAEIERRQVAGTVIGMSNIKSRRLRLDLACRPGLKVGECVPFYFCPRSVMLYIIHKANHDELEYRGGQGPILHLEADLRRTVKWAQENDKRWAFTLSNAGAYYCESRCQLDELEQLDWRAVKARDWADSAHGKQAEFLVEERFPWTLVERIGVRSDAIAQRAARSLRGGSHRPRIEIVRAWYY